MPEPAPLGSEEISGYPLHDAAREGKALLAKSLIDADPNSVNVKDQDSRTPLFWAVSSEQAEVASEILKSVKDHKNSRFQIDQSDEAGWTVLHVAASVGALQIIKDLLLPFNPDIDARTNSGQTPLQFAVSKNHIDVVRLLLEHGASPRAKDSFNRTAMHRAASIGSVPLVKLLIAAKAPINSTDRSSWTPLHHAFSEGHGDVALELINAGADPERTDSAGQTPYQVSVDEKTVKFVTTHLNQR